MKCPPVPGTDKEMKVTRSRLKKKGFSVLLICMNIFMLSCRDKEDDPKPGPGPDPLPSYPGYTLLWSEEFNGTSVDTTRWNIETGTGINGDFGTGQIDRATARPENVHIEKGVANADGGCLVLTTRKEFYIDRNYTSGRVTTQNKESWGPGHRIEARIWTRDVKYKGQGTAFWMGPDEMPAGQDHLMWPQGGEIDIMEYVGALPFVNLGSVHYAWEWNNNEFAGWNHAYQGSSYSYRDKQVPGEEPAPGGWPVADGNPDAGSGGFHIYRIDWFNDRLEFSVDNNVYHIHYFYDGGGFAADGQNQNEVRTINGKRTYVSEFSAHFPEWTPFTHKFHLLLTTGVGGSDDRTHGGAIVPEAVFPCSTYIDWVRVFKRN